jgi:hypothetical protein
LEKAMTLEYKGCASSTVALDGMPVDESPVEQKGVSPIENKMIWPGDRFRGSGASGMNQRAVAEAVKMSSGRITDLLRRLRELEIREQRRGR